MAWHLPLSPFRLCPQWSPRCTQDCVENCIATFSNSSFPLGFLTWLRSCLTARQEASRATTASSRRGKIHHFRRWRLRRFPSTLTIKPQSFFDLITWSQRLAFRMLCAGKLDRKAWSSESKNHRIDGFCRKIHARASRHPLTECDTQTRAMEC